jgi:hypothetical protein
MAKPGAFGMHLGAIVDVRGLLTYVYTLYKLGMITILLWQILLPNQYFLGTTEGLQQCSIDLED